MEGAQKRQSLLGRVGRLIEPVVTPLGWDWRIGSAVIASFPAREVVVATLGVIFDVGKDVEEGEGSEQLGSALRSATWPDSGRPVFNIPVALSVMVFFALVPSASPPWPSSAARPEAGPGRRSRSFT